ncbi:hypothetical protein JW824_10430 [bacterium]|nr:hypothetical protein [bacterium]
MKLLFKKATLVVLIVFLSLGIHWTQRKIDQYHVIRFVDKSPVFLPKGEVLKWMSMGYRGLIADWLWIRTVLYFGRRAMDEDNPYLIYASGRGELEDELESVAQQPVPFDSTNDFALQIRNELSHIWQGSQYQGLIDYIYPMLERVTTVDPHFIFPYVFGGVYILMETGEFDEASALLEKGYQANPHCWEFPFYLGWIYWIYRGNMEKTTAYLSEAVGKEKCPQYVRDLLIGISKDPERSQFTRLYLESLLQSNDNPEIREQLIEILNRLNQSSTEERVY